MLYPPSRSVPVTAEAVAANLTGRRELTKQADIETMVVSLDPLKVTPAVTLPSVIWDAMGGDEKTARTCAHCGAAFGRAESGWRYDALCRWSCPACQSEPGWRSPSLPVLHDGTPEYGLVSDVSLGTKDPAPGRRLYTGVSWRTPVRRPR